MNLCVDIWINIGNTNKLSWSINVCIKICWIPTPCKVVLLANIHRSIFIDILSFSFLCTKSQKTQQMIKTNQTCWIHMVLPFLPDSVPCLLYFPLNHVLTEKENWIFFVHIDGGTKISNTYHTYMIQIWFRYLWPFVSKD